MLIVHVTTSLGDGGAEGALFRLIKSTSNTINHEVICLRGPGKYGSVLEDIGVCVFTLNMPKGRVTIAGCWRLIKTLRERSSKGAIVQTWMYHADLVGGLAARLVGIRRLVWGIRNTKLDSSSRMTSLVVKICALLSRRVPSQVIACSVAAAEYHKSIGYCSRIDTIPNGYNLEDLVCSPSLRKLTREKLGIESFFSMGFVARWDPIKDHRNLLEAVSLWSHNYPTVKFKLLLVGHGCDPSNVELCSLIERCNLSGSVELLGQRTDIPAIMNCLDLHVLSSKSEAFPNAIAEAMACGTPCLTTNVGDAALIVGDTGWVVPPLSSLRLSEGMGAAYDAICKAPDSFANDCRTRINEMFSMDVMIEGYKGVWSRLE